LIVKGTVHRLEVHGRLVKTGRIAQPVGVGAIYQVSNGIVKPKENVILRVRDYGMGRYSRLVELVKETLQPLMGIISHRVLKPVVSHALV
jgi:hypothetical protein